MDQVGRGHSYNKSLNVANIVAGASTSPTITTRRRRMSLQSATTTTTPSHCPSLARRRSASTCTMRLVEDFINEFDLITQQPQQQEQYSVVPSRNKIRAAVQRCKSMDQSATYVTDFTPPPAPPPAVNGTKRTCRMTLQTQRRMSLQAGSAFSTGQQQERGRNVPTDAVYPTLASHGKIGSQRSIRIAQDCVAASVQPTQAPSGQFNLDHISSKPTLPLVMSRCVFTDPSTPVPVSVATPTVAKKRQRRLSLQMSSTLTVAHHQQQPTIAATRTRATKTVRGLDRSFALRFAANEHLEHYFL